MKRLLIKEIEADAKQYGDDRRTLIQQEKRATFEARVVDEPVTVVVSQKGWVRALKGHGLDPAGFTFKAGDGIYAAFQCAHARHADRVGQQRARLFGARSRCCRAGAATACRSRR